MLSDDLTFCAATDLPYSAQRSPALSLLSHVMLHSSSQHMKAAQLTSKVKKLHSVLLVIDHCPLWQVIVYVACCVRWTLTSSCTLTAAPTPLRGVIWITRLLVVMKNTLQSLVGHTQFHPFTTPTSTPHPHPHPHRLFHILLPWWQVFTLFS